MPRHSASTEPQRSGCAGGSGLPPRLIAGLWVVASSTLLSRVLGLVRDIVTARLFSVSPVMDAFALAFRVPNLARRLFGEGALSAAFLPAFARELERTPDRTGNTPWQLATSVFVVLTAVLLTLVGLGELLLAGMAIVWHGDARLRLLLGLTAVMLPYAVLICLAAQLSAVLNALGNYSRPALVPIVLNLCWIGTIWVIAPLFERDREKQAYALAVSVLFSGCLQLGLQWPTLRRLGFRFETGWRDVRAGLNDILRAMLPVTIGLSITQINGLLDVCTAWFFAAAPAGGGVMPLPGHPAFPLASGAVSVIYYGERLYQFPLGVFGVALGTVLFPLLSRHAARGELIRLRDDLTLGLRLVLVIGLPASVGLMLVADPLTRLFFEHGSFGSSDAVRTARMTEAYAAGVWAYCAIPVLYRGFYALGQRTAPLRIGLAAVAVDLVLNLTLIWPLAERGLAWSTAASAIVQVVGLTWAIQAFVGRLDWSHLVRTSARVIAATGVMAAATLFALSWRRIGTGNVDKLFNLIVPVAAGGVAYLIAARLFHLEEIRLLLRREPILPEERD